MKNVFVSGLCSFLIVFASFSQEKEISLPDFVNSFYMIKTDGLVSLEKHRG